MSQQRILLVDDHEIIRVGLKALIDNQAGLTVVAEAATVESAVAMALLHMPDIVLMDIRLLGGSGIDACREIKSVLPETKIVMLTSYADDDVLLRAIRAGADGYLIKVAGGQAIVRALVAVGQGQALLDPSVTRHIFDEVRLGLEAQDAAAFARLSGRECEVLAHVADGETNHQIGLALHLGEGTVRNYVSDILAKLSADNRAQAATYAVQHHLSDVLAAAGDHRSSQ